MKSCVLFLIVCGLQQVIGFAALRPRLQLRRVNAIELPRELANNRGEEGCKSCGDEKAPGLCTMSGGFVGKTGSITKEDLLDSNLVKIVTEEASDADVNVLVWKCLGYRYNEESLAWSPTDVFPKWAVKFPLPPDLIGVTRRYDPETDRHVRNASMDLMRSIPRDFKGGVRSLTSVGWKGYKLSELTPNKTRRAQAVNWLIYYREKLFGKTLAELQAAKQQEKAQAPDIESLPSQQWYNKLRLDDSAAEA